MGTAIKPIHYTAHLLNPNLWDSFGGIVPAEHLEGFKEHSRTVFADEADLDQAEMESVNQLYVYLGKVRRGLGLGFGVTGRYTALPRKADAPPDWWGAGEARSRGVGLGLGLGSGLR